MNRKMIGRALTLTDLVVVIALIGVLMALSLPACQKVRSDSGYTQSQNNLRQLVLGMHNHASTYDGVMPPAVYSIVDKGRGNVFFNLLPFVEQEPLYHELIAAHPLPDGVQARAATKARAPLKVLFAPLDPNNYAGSFQSSYGANANWNDDYVNPENGKARLMLPGSFSIRGTSNVVGFAEITARPFNSVDPVPTDWTDQRTVFSAGPAAAPILYPTRPSSTVPAGGSVNPDSLACAYTSAGCQVAMMDGSVRTVSHTDASFVTACSMTAATILTPDW